MPVACLRASSIMPSASAVAFAGDDGTLVSCSEDKQICCYDPVRGKLLQTIKAGKVAVHRLAFAADTSFALLGGTALKLVRRGEDGAGWKRMARLPGRPARPRARTHARCAARADPAPCAPRDPPPPPALALTRRVPAPCAFSPLARGRSRAACPPAATSKTTGSGSGVCRPAPVRAADRTA